MIGAEHFDLYCDWDNTEPNHGADPTREYNMVDLAKAVVDNGCELGLGADGDGDRIGAVDENGDFVYPDRLIALMADDVVGTEEGKDLLIYDVKCSMNVEKAIIQAGGKPMMAKTGHSFMKRVLAQHSNSLMAGEMSGHIFFADNYYGYDDAIYVAARLLELLSKTNKSLSELRSIIPVYYSTPEMRMEANNDEEKFKITKKAIEYFTKNYDCITVDGVRIKFGDGWGLVRSSNTQPVIVCRFEANSIDRRDEIMNLVLDKLKEFGVTSFRKLSSSYKYLSLIHI